MKNIDEMTPDEVSAFVGKATDAELEAYLRERSPIRAAINQAKAPKPEPVDNTQGMSGPELFAAGMGQRLMGIPRGLKEVGIGAFGSPETIANYNKEKSKTQAIDNWLLSNWEAGAGGLGADVATAALLPARLAPQVLSAAAGAATRPTAGSINGVEPLERAVNAAAAGATTLGAGKVLQLGGKTVGGMTGRYSPQGRIAMEQNEAARRLGVDRKIGDLDPASATSALERNLPGYPSIVEGQSQAFTNAARDVKDIPSKSGRSFTPRELEGEKLRDSIVAGGKELESQGSQLWQALDSHVLNNGLPPVRTVSASADVTRVVTNLTPVNKRGVAQIEKNPIYQRVDEFDPDAAKTLLTLQAPKSSLSFDELHKLQSAVGSALRRAEKDAGIPGASMEDRRARTELRRLYSSLASDVDAWAVKDKGAQALLSDAKSFWRDKVVPGTVNNKIYQKANQGVYGSTPRAYADPTQLYGDVTRRAQNMEDIFPYMPGTGQDLYRTISTMPDVAAHLTTGRLPTPAVGPLTAMAGVVAGSPFQGVRAALSHIPGTRQILGSTPAKKAYFGQDVLEGTPAGRAAWGAAQGVQQPAEGGTRRILGLKPGT